MEVDCPQDKNTVVESQNHIVETDVKVEDNDTPVVGTESGKGDSQPEVKTESETVSSQHNPVINEVTEIKEETEVKEASMDKPEPPALNGIDKEVAVVNVDVDEKPVEVKSEKDDNEEVPLEKTLTPVEEKKTDNASNDSSKETNKIFTHQNSTGFEPSLEANSEKMDTNEGSTNVDLSEQLNNGEQSNQSNGKTTAVVIEKPILCDDRALMATDNNGEVAASEAKDSKEPLSFHSSLKHILPKDKQIPSEESSNCSGMLQSTKLEEEDSLMEIPDTPKLEESNQGEASGTETPTGKTKKKKPTRQNDLSKLRQRLSVMTGSDLSQ